MSLDVVSGPSIDWLTVRWPVPLAVPEVGRPSWGAGPDGLPGPRRVGADFPRLANGASFACRVADGRAWADGNPSRLRAAHSLLGCRDGSEALSVMSELVERLSPGAGVGPAVVHPQRWDESSRRFVRAVDGAEFSRVDVCRTFQFCTLGEAATRNARRDALLFIRAMGSRSLRGTRGYLHRNGRTAVFRSRDVSVTYYAKWGRGLAPLPSDASAALKADHALVDAWLESVGAVRHEVRFSRAWLKAQSATRPEWWTAARVSSLLSEYSVADEVRGGTVVAADLERELLMRGFSGRRLSRLVEVAERWASGEDAMRGYSRASRYRVRRELLSVGFDVFGSPPEAGGSSVVLRPAPLVVPGQFVCVPAASAVVTGPALRAVA